MPDNCLMIKTTGKQTTPHKHFTSLSFHKQSQKFSLFKMNYPLILTDGTGTSAHKNQKSSPPMLRSDKSGPCCRQTVMESQ